MKVKSSCHLKNFTLNLVCNLSDMSNEFIYLGDESIYLIYSGDEFIYVIYFRRWVHLPYLFQVTGSITLSMSTFLSETPALSASSNFRCLPFAITSLHSLLKSDTILFIRLKEFYFLHTMNDI